jgi:hypothetical protein
MCMKDGDGRVVLCVVVVERNRGAESSGEGRIG